MRILPRHLAVVVGRIALPALLNAKYRNGGLDGKTDDKLRLNGTGNVGREQDLYAQRDASNASARW